MSVIKIQLQFEFDFALFDYQIVRVQLQFGLCRFGKPKKIFPDQIILDSESDFQVGLHLAISRTNTSNLHCCRLQWALVLLDKAQYDTTRAKARCDMASTILLKHVQCPPVII